MRRIQTVVATTHIDQHGDRMTRRALESMVRQVAERYRPSYLEHDYRFPPIGRVVSARLHDDADGESYVVADIDYFDESDVGRIETVGRDLHQKIHDPEHIQIIYDRSYRSEDFPELVQKLQTVADPSIKPLEETKKALEPLSFLVIAGSFVLGAIATGFLGKLGSDGWDKVASLLSRIVGKRQEKSSEFVLSFDFTIRTPAGAITNCQIHYTNPEPGPPVADLPKVIEQADTVLKQLLDQRSDIGKVSFDVVDGKPRLSYVVGRTGIPLEVADMVKYGQFVRAVRAE